MGLPSLDIVMEAPFKATLTFIAALILSFASVLAFFAIDKHRSQALLLNPTQESDSDDYSGSNIAQKDDDAGTYDVGLYVRIAAKQAKAKNYFSAMAVLTAGITEHPQALPLWFLIGELEVQAKRWHEARAVFKRIIQIDPANATAQKSLLKLEYYKTQKLQARMK